MSDQPAFRLLFVCTGNTCRSPTAQVIAERAVSRRGWDGVEVRSAGVSAAPGAGASEGARGATESHGLSLEEHRSTPLDTDLVAWASLILTMGPHHADVAEALGGSGKVWMLSAFSGSEDDARGSGVPDPFGGDSQAYVECLEALEGLVEAALGRVDAEFLSSKVGAEFPSPNKEARP
jgi:protein-tyrosine-phosphatase